jgi:hypothetical protein
MWLPLSNTPPETLSDGAGERRRNPETTPAARALSDYSHVSTAQLNGVEDLRNQMDQHARSLKCLTDVDGSFPERDDIYAFGHVESAYLIVFELRGWSRTRNMD